MYMFFIYLEIIKQKNKVVKLLGGPEVSRVLGGPTSLGGPNFFGGGGGGTPRHTMRDRGQPNFEI